MDWTISATDRQRALDLAGSLLPHCPDMHATLTHLAQRLGGVRH